MRIVDPAGGESYFEKRRRRYNEPHQPRELTFSCHRRIPFLSRERTCAWFIQAIESARSKFGFQLWAYVLMIAYIHANPVRRGLVVQPEDWEWSSARSFAGIRPVKIEMDDQVLEELARE